MEQTIIYTASVDCLKDPRLLQRTLDLLPAARRDAALRMKVEGGRRLSAGAGLLLLTALTDWMRRSALPDAFPGGQPDGRSGGPQDGLPCRGMVCSANDLARWKDLRISEGKQGKPYLPDWPEVHFNLSHSGSRVMCAISPEEVGCDVQLIEPEHIDKVIRCLAESEQVLARASCVDFYRIWTLKESILKLTGQGLQIPLKSFEVSLDPLSVRQAFLPGTVRLKEYDCFREGSAAAGHGEASGTEQYCCSAAMMRTDPPETLTEVDFRQVIQEPPIPGKLITGNPQA